MATLNKVTIIGHVGRDPEIRMTNSEIKVASFSVATTDKGYTLQNGTQVPERTEWHNVVAWRGLADVCDRYIRKGMLLYVEGKLQTQSWEKDGVKRYKTEIIADNIQMLTKKDDETTYYPEQKIEPTSNFKDPQRVSMEPETPSSSHYEDDDNPLPF